jgi:hypothetical protein
VVADAAMLTKTTTMTLTTTMIIMMMINMIMADDDIDNFNTCSAIFNVAGIQAKSACA